MGNQIPYCCTGEQDSQLMQLNNNADPTIKERSAQTPRRQISSSKGIINAQVQKSQRKLFEEFSASHKQQPPIQKEPQMIVGQQYQQVVEAEVVAKEQIQQQFIQPEGPIFGKELKEMPNYLSDSGKEIERILGPFEYMDTDDITPGEIVKGPIELDNGAIYLGHWTKDGLRQGRGIQIWQDGTKYEGNWGADQTNGKGRLIHADGDFYEGLWFNDRAHGMGVYVHIDGARYSGEWAMDRQHGYGTEIWPDDTMYEGNYETGKKHGVGNFKWADGSSYVGEFYQNQFNGTGVYTWGDGRRYEGQWVKNRMLGEGMFTWKDGRSYNGNYKDDVKDGKGAFTWIDGSVYNGEWKDGLQHGLATFTFLDKSEKYGEWREGKRKFWIS